MQLFPYMGYCNDNRQMLQWRTWLQIVTPRDFMGFQYCYFFGTVYRFAKSWSRFLSLLRAGVFSLCWASKVGHGSWAVRTMNGGSIEREHGEFARKHVESNPDILTGCGVYHYAWYYIMLILHLQDTCPQQKAPYMSLSFPSFVSGVLGATMFLSVSIYMF